jgi:hypothetical protein
MPESYKKDERRLHHEHLTRVRALSQQVTSAISAIERNDLEQLVASVAAQEMLCQEIAQTNVRSSAATDQNIDGVAKEIRDAHIALAKVNRVYAALLKRVHRSCHLMITVYRSHGHVYAQPGSAASERHTWSCEG